MRTAVPCMRGADVAQFDERVFAPDERIAITRCVFAVPPPDLSKTSQTLSVVARLRLQ